MKKTEFKNLVEKYLEGRASEKEESMLFKYYDALQEDDIFWDETAMGNQETVHEELYSRILNDIEHGGSNRPYFNNWIRVAAACFILLSFGLLLFQNFNQEKKYIAVASRKGRIQPGSNKAYLTLSDGKKITLTGTSDGTLAKQSGVQISKTADGKLIYTVIDNSSAHKDGLEYNTIETPRGGQYQVLLPDGTKVWLNAASSLKYPTSFASLKERKVELKGEGYFEVAHNKNLPFRVITQNQVVEVLGTHFNIDSYADEENIKTTLLEGSVKVSRQDGGSQVMLKPGQQALLSLNDPEIIVQHVDTDLSVAWKEGYFIFSNEKLGSVMKKLARWYNVEVEYADPSAEEGLFYGTVSRYASISKLLDKLEIAGDLKFKIEGNKIKVLNK